MEAKKIETIDIPHYTEGIFYELQRTARVLKVHAEQFFMELKLGITPEEYSTLDVIMCNSNICQRDLARLLLKDRANTGRVLDKLEGKKLITRTLDTKNNRLVKLISITSAGVQTVKEVNNAIITRFAGLSACISPDEVESIKESLATFRKTVEKFIQNKI